MPRYLVMKRGQATIFIILGIVIVALVAISYPYKEQLFMKAAQLGMTKVASLPPEFQEKQTVIESCLQELLNSALITASTQGGYSGTSPGGSYMFGEVPIAYYFDQGKDKTPKKETVAAEIAKLIKPSAMQCAADIGVSEPKTATARVTMKGAKVNAEVTMPVTVSIGETTKTINNFAADSKVNLEKMIDVAQQIVKQQATDPENLCLTCINDIAAANEVEVNIEPYPEAIVVMITDSKSLIEGQPLEFEFAMRY